MRAPRASAKPSSSSTRTPEPSPITKPSRSRSNGRLAFSGASFRVDRARIAAKPPTPIGVMAASEPPAIITSASPRRITSLASPSACADAAQAVQVAMFGPFAPYRIDTWPAARLMIAAGMKNGEILPGPPSSSLVCSRSIVANPPMPEAMKTPTREAFPGPIARPESSIANCEAAMAYWMKTSIFLTSFFSTNWSGSNPLTSAAICASKAAGSNLVIRATPLCPATSACQLASVPIATGERRPIPVMTTRLLTLPPLKRGSRARTRAGRHRDRGRARRRPPRALVDAYFLPLACASM